MTPHSFFRTEQEIIDTYCLIETFDAHEIAMVKRLLLSFDPDVIIMMTETDPLNVMTAAGTMPTPQPTPQSPAPSLGILAGLGAAAVVLRLRKQSS